MDVDSYRLFQYLRHYSPAAFGAFLDAGGFQVISSSPEQFLNLNQGVVSTRPMKGTRSRGLGGVDDTVQKKDLESSRKDKAELLMITDLMRNDLGRVCDFGSIHVTSLRDLEIYSTVYQTTSTIRGRLDRDKDCFDLLEACFPGGSITGCPKIRSMQIIEELEPTARGPYTGSLGYVDFSGNMHFNILIRSMMVNHEKVSYQVGGGIVADSKKEEEYDETLIKAQAMKQTLAYYYGQTQSLTKPLG